jgi:two-component system, response regulator
VRRALRAHPTPLRIEVAHDGVEALEFLHGPQRLRPRAVLLDLKMPRLGGFEVLRRLREDPRTAHLPVIVFSSSKEPSDVRRSYLLGADSFLQKPVEFSAFQEAVQLMGAYWLGLNVPPTSVVPPEVHKDGSPTASHG